jgi:hypothetical protein
LSIGLLSLQNQWTVDPFSQFCPEDQIGQLATDLLLGRSGMTTPQAAECKEPGSLVQYSPELAERIGA